MASRVLADGIQDIEVSWAHPENWKVYAIHTLIVIHNYINTYSHVNVCVCMYIYIYIYKHAVYDIHIA